jgi:hypothetical protein
MRRSIRNKFQDPRFSLRNTLWTTVLVLIGLVALAWLSTEWSANAARRSATEGRGREVVTELDANGLIRELEDPSADVRSLAAKGLGLSNDARAVNALERAAASDQSASVRDTARKALALLKEYWATSAAKRPEHVGALAVAPDDADLVYLAELDQFSVSRDGGSTWTALGNPLPNQVSAIAIDPSQQNVMYAGVDSRGLYKSTDGGETWHTVNDGWGLAAGVPLRITALAIDPDNPERIFAARAVWIGTSRVVLIPLGVMESHDGGVTWNSVALPEIEQPVGHLIVRDGKLYATAGEQLISQ